MRFINLITIDLFEKKKQKRNKSKQACGVCALIVAYILKQQTCLRLETFCETLRCGNFILIVY